MPAIVFRTQWGNNLPADYRICFITQQMHALFDRWKSHRDQWISSINEHSIEFIDVQPGGRALAYFVVVKKHNCPAYDVSPYSIGIISIVKNRQGSVV